MKHFNERVETLKKDYQQFLEEGNIIGIRSIEKEIDKIINKWTYKNTKISNNKERDRQELLREKTVTFLNEIRATIIKMEMDMEENNIYNSQSNMDDTIIEMHKKYTTEIDMLLNDCVKCLADNNSSNIEKTINQISITFNKWDELIIINPSVKPDDYDKLHDLFEKYRIIGETIINKEKENNNKKTTNNNNNTEKSNSTENTDTSFLSENWKCITVSGTIGVILGAVAAFFFVGNDN